ncbi:MAG: type II toxin-antitoxin system Phd/YefM family antitoxin [Spirochaetia bacterium]|jgi:prevent-host-death family protein|nr:type II toxin-antitoxin system Phd/YefM family antitoxin [Spirochaetia bacterium]
MKAIGIFEVKAKISAICETVRETHEPVLITKRGIPMVRIIPLENTQKKSNIWNQRQEFIENNGLFTEELTLPARKEETIFNLFDD